MATATAFPLPAGDRTIAELVHGARAGRAVRHAFIARCAASTGPDGALRAFAHALHGAAAFAPQHLEAALPRVPAALRAPWQRRLARELGHLDEHDCSELRAIGIAPSTVLGQSRATLAARFAEALGWSAADLASPSPSSRRWRTDLLHFLQQATPAEAIGALVLGGDALATAAVAPVLAALLQRGDLRRDALAWFELQTLGEGRHLADLFQLVTAATAMPRGHDELRAGLVHALGLRAAFLDDLQAATNARPLARTA